MTVLETATGVQDQVLDAIKTSQDALLAAVKAVAENTTPLTDKLPAAPFASQLPDGTNVINTAFGFAEKLLVLSAHQKQQVPVIQTRRWGAALVFEKLWRETGCPAVIAALLRGEYRNTAGASSLSCSRTRCHSGSARSRVDAAAALLYSASNAALR